MDAAPQAASAPGLLDRAAIFASDDHILERVDVPEWGGFVYCKTLGGAERDDFEQEHLDEKGNRKSRVANIRANLVARTVCDGDGNLLFGPGDVKALGKKNAKPLDRLFEVAMRLSGLSDKDIEDLAGN